MTHGLLLKDKGRNFMVPFPLSFSLPHSPSVIHLHWYDLVNILHRWAMTDFFFLGQMACIFIPLVLFFGFISVCVLEEYLPFILPPNFPTKPRRTVLVFSLVSSLGNAFAEALTHPPFPVLKGQFSHRNPEKTVLPPIEWELSLSSGLVCSFILLKHFCQELSSTGALNLSLLHMPKKIFTPLSYVHNLVKL